MDNHFAAATEYLPVSHLKILVRPRISMTLDNFGIMALNNFFCILDEGAVSEQSAHFYAWATLLSCSKPNQQKIPVYCYWHGCKSTGILLHDKKLLFLTHATALRRTRLQTVYPLELKLRFMHFVNASPDTTRTSAELHFLFMPGNLSTKSTDRRFLLLLSPTHQAWIDVCI